MIWWSHLSALGGLNVTALLALAIAAWLVGAHCWRLALAWCLLFGGALAITFGVWDLVTGTVWVPGALVIAFVISGVTSLVLLNRQREAFAQRVQTRAEKATRAFDEMRAKEDRE